MSVTGSADPLVLNENSTVRVRYDDYEYQFDKTDEMISNDTVVTYRGRIPLSATDADEPNSDMKPSLPTPVVLALSTDGFTLPYK